MSRAVLVLLPVVAVLGARSRESPPAPATISSVITAPSAASAIGALDRMDTRAAVPLLPMMANHQKQNTRDHLVAVQQIVAAVATEDFAGVERAAGRIGFSEQMGQMCAHMGAGAPGFTEQALNFPQTGLDTKAFVAPVSHPGIGVQLDVAKVSELSACSTSGSRHRGNRRVASSCRCLVRSC